MPLPRFGVGWRHYLNRIQPPVRSMDGRSAIAQTRCNILPPLRRQRAREEEQRITRISYCSFIPQVMQIMEIGDWENIQGSTFYVGGPVNSSSYIPHRAANCQCSNPLRQNGMYRNGETTPSAHE
jgi:hypothetical protein